MPFAIASVLKAKRQNNAPIPQRITRFRKVTTKMLQHGASDLQATMAAEPREGKKVSGQEPMSFKTGTGKYVHLVINIG